MTTEILQDKRQFHRIFYHALASVSTESTTYPCQIIDLSLNGCLLKFEIPWEEDAEKKCEFRLRLSEDIGIVMEILLTHNLGNEAGFQCTHIDIDSISELKRLVELNLGSSDLLERDMQALITASTH